MAYRDKIGHYNAKSIFGGNKVLNFYWQMKKFVMGTL